jgi:uncharacterized membrane protein YraQ (UPF0718 family)
VVAFLFCYFLPIERSAQTSVFEEPLLLVKWYAREHVLLCLIPAFFIAGAVGVFVSQASVMKYLGVRANKVLSYGVASISGTILAVCSCTILPLFAGIYRMGAGLGPACAFLYSGPAINVLAIILTARVLGFRLGVARALGAILFSIVIGCLMHIIFRKEEAVKEQSQASLPEVEAKRPLWQTALFFTSLVGILVFANVSRPEEFLGLWAAIYSLKWVITSICAVAMGIMLVLWFEMKWWKIFITAASVIACAGMFPEQPLIAFSAGAIGVSIFTSTDKGEVGEWFLSTWDFAKQILPLLLFGILIAGFMFGSIGGEGIVPANWVAQSVGGNSFAANFFASVAGALMYFATLTEVPILQGLIDKGMGQGPALALLLAGPALSLPSMLVIRSILGTKKALTFIGLVIVLATVSGLIFGYIEG